MELQSAVEYLVTYGWAILLIMAVLAITIYLGFFNSSIQTGTLCNGLSGFLCQNPYLAPNGLLTAYFSYAGSQISITGTGCTTNSSEPATFNSIIAVNTISEQTTPLHFQCPLMSRSLGSAFTGTLWVEYTQSGGSGIQVAEAGRVSTSVG